MHAGGLLVRTFHRRKAVALIPNAIAALPLSALRKVPMIRVCKDMSEVCVVQDGNLTILAPFAVSLNKYPEMYCVKVLAYLPCVRRKTHIVQAVRVPLEGIAEKSRNPGSTERMAVGPVVEWLFTGLEGFWRTR